MRYLTPIISTVFFVVASVAFGMELKMYGMAPPAQYVVMLFLFIFVMLVWVAQMQTMNAPVGRQMYYRVIAEHSVFPVMAFVVQLVIAAAYFFAWNMPFRVGMVALRMWLPQGVFIPLVVDLVLLAITVVLWMGNDKANAHTQYLHSQQQDKESQKEMLQAQLLLLRQRIDSTDETSLSVMRFIDQKVQSLPLQLSGASAVAYQQAVQQIIKTNQTPGSVTAETLSQIKTALMMIH